MNPPSSSPSLPLRSSTRSRKLSHKLTSSLNHPVVGCGSARSYEGEFKGGKGGGRGGSDKDKSRVVKKYKLKRKNLPPSSPSSTPLTSTVACIIKASGLPSLHLPRTSLNPPPYAIVDATFMRRKRRKVEEEEEDKRRKARATRKLQASSSSSTSFHPPTLPKTPPSPPLDLGPSSTPWTLCGIYNVHSSLPCGSTVLNPPKFATELLPPLLPPRDR